MNLSESERSKLERKEVQFWDELMKDWEID